MKSRTLMTECRYICQACSEQTKGVYFYESPEQNETECGECGGTLEVRIGGFRAQNIFPFVHPHLTGEGPVVVESLHHLRGLERKYGVQAHAFSNNASNVEGSSDLPRFRPGGREYEG